jgi:hypothetical protein
MALAWNTSQLLSAGSGDKPASATPVEFHFLSRRELFDSTISTVDRYHSSAGEWAVLGDHHWYSVAVITHPVYTIPQELCLSFDCFSKTETAGTSQLHGPPIDDVALEFGALLSLLVREPLLPLGTRRISGKPCKFDPFGHVYRPLPSKPIPPMGVNSTELRAIISGLANAAEKDSNAILAATRLYHAALSLSAYDISTAYFSLVAAIECVSGHHLEEKKFNFDDVEKFKEAGKVIKQISVSVSDSAIIKKLKCKMVRAEHFVWQKFREFVEDFLPDEFWQREDEMYPELSRIVPFRIEKSSLRPFLRQAYDARSAFAHSGAPFPAYVEVGLSEHVRAKTMMQVLDLASSGRFVPPFIWFERLTHFVLREYLLRVIAPARAEDRAKRAEE